jgi:hypothetical protein
MPARRRTWNTPAVVASQVDADWCWCGNRVVARCVDCHAPICERHRIQDGTPPPDLVHYHSGDNGGPVWPYHWDSAWVDADAECGWLGPALAEQLFHTGFGTRADLALCRDCRTRSGLDLVDSWRAVAPPNDGWDRAMWLLDQGFEPGRVVMTVNVGPPSHAVRRFLTRAAERGIQPTSTLTVLWSVDRQGRVSTISEAAGWTLKGAASIADTPAHVFISTDGESYVFARDKDASVGRILPHKLGRVTEYKRLPDDRWRPALLALYAFELSNRGGLAIGP